MTAGWIVHGDVTTSGGRMISSSPFTVHGRGRGRGRGRKGRVPQGRQSHLPATHRVCFRLRAAATRPPSSTIRKSPCWAPRSPAAAKLCPPGRCVCTWMQAEVRWRVLAAVRPEIRQRWMRAFTSTTLRRRGEEKFKRVSKIVLHNEGGFVDDTDDAGGVTNMGIAWPTW